jgi:hypothetical protein
MLAVDFEFRERAVYPNELIVTIPKGSTYKDALDILGCTDYDNWAVYSGGLRSLDEIVTANQATVVHSGKFLKKQKEEERHAEDEKQFNSPCYLKNAFEGFANDASETISLYLDRLDSAMVKLEKCKTTFERVFQMNVVTGCIENLMDVTAKFLERIKEPRRIAFLHDQLPESKKETPDTRNWTWKEIRDAITEDVYAIPKICRPMYIANDGTASNPTLQTMQAAVEEVNLVAINLLHHVEVVRDVMKSEAEKLPAHVKPRTF